jgi:hypothetical protein
VCPFFGRENISDLIYGSNLPNKIQFHSEWGIFCLSYLIKDSIENAKMTKRKFTRQQEKSFATKKKLFDFNTRNDIKKAKYP